MRACRGSSGRKERALRFLVHMGDWDLCELTLQSLPLISNAVVSGKRSNARMGPLSTPPRVSVLGRQIMLDVNDIRQIGKAEKV